jgi:hypothetical protein
MHVKMRIRQCGHCKRQFRTKEIIDPSLKLPSESRSKKQDDNGEEADIPETINPYHGEVG